MYEGMTQSAGPARKNTGREGPECLEIQKYKQQMTDRSRSREIKNTSVKEERYIMRQKIDDAM